MTIEEIEPKMETNHPTQTYAVGIKQTPFWIRKPAMWFLQLEAQFALAGITQDMTKYHHVLSSINEDIMEDLEDVLSKPPTTGKYEHLKKEMINRFSVSQEKKTIALLEEEQIGDRTPSQFLRHLRSLGGAAVTEELIRTIWTRRLPANLQSIIVAQTDLALEKLAEIADKVDEAMPRRSISEVTRERKPAITNNGQIESQLASLSEQMTDIKIEIEELRKDRPRTSRRNEEEPRRDHRDRSSSHGTRIRSPICWYHRRFGQKSTRCTTPCEWNSKNERCGQ